MAAAVASRHGLFVRGDIVNGMRLTEKVGLFSHELAHVSQMEMRLGGRGAPAHWIREGHADWVKYQTLELLQMRPYAESREEVKRSILRSLTAIRFFPPLNELARGDRWTEAGIQLGSAATYGQSFLAVDWLVEHAKPITVEQAQARDKLWTPEREAGEAAPAGGSRLWTPGS